MLRRMTIFALISTATCAVAGEYPIAGVKPWERPQGAPMIVKFNPPQGWEKKIHFGVSQPYPATLAWISDQGAWYTPFNRPGMTGVYDIRGWHADEKQK